MPAVANLTITGGAAVTYYPKKVIAGSEAYYIDRTNPVIAGQSVLSFFMSESATVRKVTGKVTYPTLNATTNVLSYTHLGSFELKAPLQGTKAERTEVRLRTKDAIGNAVVTSMFDDGEGVY